MPTQNVSFSIGNTSGTLATGTFVVDDTGVVVGISGSIDGAPIEGISGFDGADNTLTFYGGTYTYFGHRYYYDNYYTVDSRGISFTAGDSTYNLSNVTPPQGFGHILGIGGPDTTAVSDKLTSGAGQSEAVTLTASYSYSEPGNLCFAEGTRIETPSGIVPVEDLRPGDIAVTHDGGHRLIVWIGSRVVGCSSSPEPASAFPIRIRAEAFGANRPARELRLSPGHPVLVTHAGDEYLVPIMCLINGTTIARMPVESVTYWHVELDQHDILLAEGLPAESFLDFGCRDWFENGADHALANPDFIPPGLNGRCRPVVVDGPAVEAERRRLDAIFAMSLAAQCAWPSEDAHLPLVG